MGGDVRLCIPVDLGPFTACNSASPYIIKVSAMPPPATSVRAFITRNKKKIWFPAAALEALDFRTGRLRLASGPLISGARRHGGRHDICVDSDASVATGADRVEPSSLHFGCHHDLKTWQRGLKLPAGESEERDQPILGDRRLLQHFLLEHDDMIPSSSQPLARVKYHEVRRQLSQSPEPGESSQGLGVVRFLRLFQRFDARYGYRRLETR